MSRHQVPPYVPSDGVAEEALAILERGDIEPVPGAPGVVIVVGSRGDAYAVRATSAGVLCECAGFARTSACSHTVAAMCRWHSITEARGRLLGRLLEAQHEQDQEREREIRQAMSA